MFRKIANTYRDSFTGLSREIWLLSFVMLINRASTMVVPFMSMYITQSMHRSLTDAGLIITLFGVGSVLGSASGGYFIDKLGFRPVQIFTSLVGGILFMVFGHINHFPTLCAMTVVLSFVAEAFRPANFAAIATYSTPEKLTRSYSLNRLATNIGWGLGISIAGVLAAINYHLLFWVEGGTYILVSILITLLLPKARQQKKAITNPDDSIKSSSPWRDPFLLRFIICSIIYITCFMLMFRLVPVYWKEVLKIPEWMIGLFLGLNGLIIAAFEMVMVRRWENKRPNMHYIILGALATACGYLFLITPGIPPLIIATGTVILISTGEMLAFPFINTVIMSRANEKNRGKYAASYALSWSVAQISGPGGGALIAQRWGFTALWLLLVVLCIGCALVFKSLSRREQETKVFVEA
jgi:predicted MFS family arabinose efflux permease